MIVPTGYRYAIGAFTLALVVGVSFWTGMRFEAAGYAKERITIAEAYAEHANSNFDALRTKIDTAERRAAFFDKRRTAALSRVQELEHALANLPPRPDGDFTDDELHVFTALHRQYFGTDTGRVPDGVQHTPNTEQP